MTVNTTAVGSAITSTPEQKTMFDLINSSTRELAKALPKHLSPERLTRIATTCIRQNPKLAQCTHASFMGSLFVCAQMGLEPVAGLAHLVPFSNSKCINGQWAKVLECQLIIGFKGVAELFYRHEKSGIIDWGVVHEKDDITFEYGTNANLKHKPKQGERGPVIGYYGIFKLISGLSKFLYMTKTECMEHGKKHSKTYDSAANAFNKKSPWATNPDAMCLKTVLLQTAKTAPMSTELRRALDADETSREFKDGVTDALDLPVTTKWEEAEIEPIAKADTSKVSAAIGQDPTPEELLAKAEKAKEAFHAEDGTKEAPAQPQTAPNEDKGLSAKGIVANYYPAKGRGPSSFKIGDNQEYLKTFNKGIVDTLIDHKAEGDEVEVTYEMVTKGEYTNAMIISVSVQAENMMGDAQLND